MSRPARVGDAHVSGHALVEVDVLALLEDLLLQQLDLTRALDQDCGGVGDGSIHPDTSRVIAAILKTFEASNQNVQNLFSCFRCEVIEVCENATHYELMPNVTKLQMQIGSVFYFYIFIASTNPHSYRLTMTGEVSTPAIYILILVYKWLKN